jgi:type III secretion protein Q
MITEDLYQDDIESLDDYDEQTGDKIDEQAHQQHWTDTEENAGYAAARTPFEDDQPDAPTQSTALDSLALELTVTCGELRLTLAELRRLDVGTILQVSGVAPGYATLCHGERVVAEGELVDVDGRLGLQITRMAAQA